MITKITLIRIKRARKMEYSYIDRTQKKQEEKSRNHDIEWYRRIFKQEEKNVFGWITSDDPKS